MSTFGHGRGFGALLNGKDLTRFSTDFNTATDIDQAEQTCAQAPGGGKSFLYGNSGSSAGLDGRMAKSLAEVQRALAAIYGQEDDPKLFLLAPFGFAPGNWGFMYRTRSQSYRTTGGLTSVVGTGGTFQGDGAERVGRMLQAPRLEGGGTLTLGEVQQLVWTAVDPNQFFSFRANGTTPLTTNFQLATYISSGVVNTTTLCAFVKAQIEGLAAYAGRTVTVTVASAFSISGGLWTGALLITFDGTVNVPQIEPVSGAVRRQQVIGGDTGNYTFDGGATVTLGISQANFQTNQRAINAAHAAVVCIGSSAAAYTATNMGTLMPAFRRQISGSGARNPLNGKMYVFGGVEFFGGANATNTIYEFDPATGNVATKTAVLPTAQNTAAVIWSTAISRFIIVGGQGDGTAIYHYDPATDTLTTPAVVLPAARSVTNLCESGGKIYIVSGSGLTSILEYNPATLAVVTKSATTPTPIGWAAQGFVGGKFYFCGVDNGDGVGRSVYKYDPANDTFTAMTAMLPAKSFSSSWSCDGTNIWIFADTTAAIDGTVGAIYKYTPGTDTMATVTTTPSIIHSQSCGVYDPGTSKTYLISGFVGGVESRLVTAYDLNATPGTLDFVSYFPVTVTPTAPTATGTGAVNTSLVEAGTIQISLTGVTSQPGGTFKDINPISAPLTGTAVKTCAATHTNGATLDLHAPYVSIGTVSVPVVVQHAPDVAGSPGAWTTLGTFATITDGTNAAQCAQRLVVPAGTSINPWKRVTVAAITGTVTLGVIAADRDS